MAEVTLRPATRADADECVRVQLAAFADLDRRRHEPEEQVSEVQRTRARGRIEHFVEHDPEGSWVAVADGAIVGCAFALKRDRLWGLSLLVVDPAAQSAGAGRRLIDATLRYAEGCDRAIVQSSSDARAIRTYATSGFELYPQVTAKGRPSMAAAPPSVTRVRIGTTQDLAFADGIDHRVRGAGRGPDHAWIAGFAPMYVVDDADGQGYAYLRDADVYLLAATDDDTASALLWRCLQHNAELGLDTTVPHITAEQQWAVRAALAAGLAIRPDGPVFWRGITPPRAYLPSGAYL